MLATTEMQDRTLQLTLSAGESIPKNLSWRIEDGYLMAVSSTEEVEKLVLGIWGTGELVIPKLIKAERLKLLALSPVVVEECKVELFEELSFQQNMISQMAELLEMLRIRPAEYRLLLTLLWLGGRFGRVNSQGTSLSTTMMKLTHNNLAMLTGMTRVTITRLIGKYKKHGFIVEQGDDYLIPAGAATALRRCENF